MNPMQPLQVTGCHSQLGYLMQQHRAMMRQHSYHHSTHMLHTTIQDEITLRYFTMHAPPNMEWEAQSQANARLECCKLATQTAW
jgi:hypothetical protein